jgi:prepilin-type N-terminal cleavage/methylation domain-containing protein/prepilin-type processing-associated H-X9-DG protein
VEVVEERVRRGAFTLLELLVVMAIIGAVVSLCLPAIQKVREMAHRAKCAANLRQVGMANHLYHDFYGMLPVGTNTLSPRDNHGDLHFFWSWLARVLPFCEQDNLFREAEGYMNDVSWRPYGNWEVIPPVPGNPAQAQPLPLFQCPSDMRTFTAAYVPPNPSNPDARIDVAFTSYLGVSGRNFFTRDGVFLPITLYGRERIRFEDVTDGLSNTLLAGERPPSADLIFGWWFDGQGQVFNGSADVIMGVAEENHIYDDCPSGPYAFRAGNLNDKCDTLHYWSLHSGGANFCFVDGSIHFLSYAQSGVLTQLSTRAAGEPVEYGD